VASQDALMSVPAGFD